jgi:hypothetical protein
VLRPATGPQELFTLNLKKMFEIMLAIFLAFGCPVHHDHKSTGGYTTLSDPPDTGGEGGHIPPGGTSTHP